MTAAATVWVAPMMRAGYLARGVVYGTIGYLAVRAAWIGGSPKGAQQALTSLIDESFGKPLLYAVAGGALGFAIWSAMASAFDLDHRGRDAAGIFARIDFAVTSVIYLAIAVFVADLAARGYATGSGNGREEGTAWLLSLPAGGWIVIGVGIGFIAAGIWFGYKGLAGKYRERLRRSETVRRLDPVCKFGWIAYGVVIVILGLLLIWAGWTRDASRAGGFADAFMLIRSATPGRALLFIVGFGFIAFAVECMVEAAFRYVPALPPGSGLSLGEGRPFK